MYTIHGHEVIKHARCKTYQGERPGNVVLVDCGDAVQRWATAIHFDGDRGWWAGHYFFDREKAEADYRLRVARNCGPFRCGP